MEISKIRRLWKTHKLLKNEDNFREFKNGFPDDDELERTLEVIEVFVIGNVEGLTHLYSKTGVILLEEKYEIFFKVSDKECDINPLYCVPLPGFIWGCAWKNTNLGLKHFKTKI